MKDLVHGCRIERADAFLLLSMGVFIGACQMVFCVIFLKLSLNIQTILYIFACFCRFLENRVLIFSEKPTSISLLKSGGYPLLGN